MNVIRREVTFKLMPLVQLLNIVNAFQSHRLDIEVKV